MVPGAGGGAGSGRNGFGGREGGVGDSLRRDGACRVDGEFLGGGGRGGGVTVDDPDVGTCEDDDDEGELD